MFQNYKIMKKTVILCVLALAALTSCEPSLYFEQNAGFIDYSAFPGMFLTESNSVSFEYQPIASLYAEEISRNYKVGKKKIGSNEVDGDEYAVTDGSYRKANPQSALAFAIEKAKAMGGNGIVNLKINADKAKDGRSMYYVTGMVIRRK
jgi:uncharacterized protein YbjQ (UPF0145 family)